MATEMTRTDYPRDPVEGTPLETPPDSWVPSVIDVYQWLGYSMTYKNRHDGTGNTRIEPDDSRAISVHRLVAWLQYWEVQLKDMTTTAMANEVGQLKLDFIQGVASVKLEASRTLQELATLIDVPILRDKYYPKTKKSPFQVTSLL